MCAGGLPVANKTNADDVIQAAIEIQDFMHKHKLEREAQNLPYFQLRIGIHTGPVVAGIVGIIKFAYDIWGDTVNVAAAMERQGVEGKLISPDRPTKLSNTNTIAPTGEKSRQKQRRN